MRSTRERARVRVFASIPVAERDGEIVKTVTPAQRELIKRILLVLLAEEERKAAELLAKRQKGRVM